MKAVLLFIVPLSNSFLSILTNKLLFSELKLSNYPYHKQIIKIDLIFIVQRVKLLRIMA